jgi:predicted regulator of Ras-like GTPase activity (Roadblock/LC7/MglB family)
MQGNAVYLLAAGIVFVVVVALLLVWTSRQMRKHSQDAAPAIRERPGSGRRAGAGGGAHPDVPAEPPEPARAVEPAELEESVESLPAMGVPEAAVVSAGTADSGEDAGTWAAPADFREVTVPDAANRDEGNAVTGKRVNPSAASAAPGELSAHFPALVFSFGAEEMRDASGSDGGATGNLPDLASKMAESPSSSGHTEREEDFFVGRLREAGNHPAVIGWLLIDQDGASQASDQTYDDEVVAMLASLAAQAERTAQTVGLTHAREFAVRGVEGMIYLIPIRCLGAGRDGYAAVFVEEDRLTAAEVAHMLGARDENAQLSGPGR